MLFSLGNMSHISYEPYGPARAFIAKLLRKSPYPYEGRIRDGASRAGKSSPALLEKRGGHIIKRLLTELGRAGQEMISGPRSWRTALPRSQ